MKKNLILAALLATTSVFLSCDGEGSEGRSMKFEIGEDRVINLKNANAYLVHSWTFTSGPGAPVRDQGASDTHKGRTYVITDGTRNSNDEYYSIQGYTDASYLISFEVMVPIGSEFEDGTYSIRTDVFGFGANDKGVSFYFEDSDGVWLQPTLDDYDDIEFDGDLDGTFELHSFMGSVQYSLLDDDFVDCEIYFKGTFENVIPL
jgi:hypothetical protein